MPHEQKKSYGFSPWVDQVDTINQIMKDNGERNESALLRKLVDEALDAPAEEKAISSTHRELG